MRDQNLVQYIFWDGHEEITNEKGKIIIIKDFDIDYSFLNEKPAPKIKGSVPNLDTLTGFSKVPKIGEYLITFKGFLIFGKHYISNVPIRAIDRDFQLQRTFE